jgi:uncharacterized membrane protein YjfL (UPF0719 family)
MVATGIIASASIRLDNGVFYYSVMYFIIGQLLMWLVMLIYNVKLKSSVDSMKQEIEQGNTTFGIYMAGKLIAYGLILHAAIYGIEPDTVIVKQLVDLFVVFIMASILLAVIEWLIDKVIMNQVNIKTALRENQVMQVMQLTFIKVSAALIIAFTLV